MRDSWGHFGDIYYRLTWGQNSLFEILWIGQNKKNGHISETVWGQLLINAGQLGTFRGHLI